MWGWSPAATRGGGSSSSALAKAGGAATALKTATGAWARRVLAPLHPRPLSPPHSWVPRARSGAHRQAARQSRAAGCVQPGSAPLRPRPRPALPPPLPLLPPLPPPPLQATGTGPRSRPRWRGAPSGRPRRARRWSGSDRRRCASASRRRRRPAASHRAGAWCASQPTATASSATCWPSAASRTRRCTPPARWAGCRAAPRLLRAVGGGAGVSADFASPWTHALPLLLLLPPACPQAIDITEVTMTPDLRRAYVLWALPFPVTSRAHATDPAGLALEQRREREEARALREKAAAAAAAGGPGYADVSRGAGGRGGRRGALIAAAPPSLSLLGTPWSICRAAAGARQRGSCTPSRLRRRRRAARPCGSA